MTDVKTWAAGAVFRLPAPWEIGRPAAYHVEVGEYVEVPGREPINLGTKHLTAEEAEAQGHPLAAIVEGINDALMLDITRLEAERDSALIRAEAAEQRVAALQIAHDDKHVEAEQLRSAFAWTDPHDLPMPEDAGAQGA